ncbi:MAG: adenylyltransferase/cytidyltransferase family protein [Candidatus Anstonellales archaeon]
MSKKEIAKKLYILSLKGIKERDLRNLSPTERKMLCCRKGSCKLKKEFRKLIKVVLTGGVFDIIHAGHLFTLKEAKKYGDVLVVSIAKESFIRGKGREPLHSQKERAELVGALKPVDIALMGKKNPSDMLKIVKPDVIVYGYDQKPFIKPKGVKIVMLKKKVKPHYLKSSKILKKIR